MSETTDVGATAIERVAAELRGRERFLLTAHEGPDGDALGSLLGMHHLLTQLGKDSVMFLAAKEFPLPIEYRFLPLEEVFHEPPADMADRTVDLPRLRQHRPHAGRLPHRRATTSRINIDHHHDNTLFGDVNLVEIDASCTAEIVYELAVAARRARSRRRSPRRSTSAWSPTPASSCTRTPTRAPTGSPPT